MSDHRAVIELLLVDLGVGKEWPTLAQADSFTILAFVIELKEKTGIDLPPTALVPSNFESVDSILALIAEAAPAP